MLNCVGFFFWKKLESHQKKAIIYFTAFMLSRNGFPLAADSR